MMTSQSIDTNNHRSIHGHRYRQSNSPNIIGSRTMQTLNDYRSGDPDLQHDNGSRNPENYKNVSRKTLDSDTNYYSSSQESGTSKRVTPMWSPSPDNQTFAGNQNYNSTRSKFSASQRTSTQAEIEKLDDLLQELTPRLNDSPTEYLRRRRQSFSNSSKSQTSEERSRQDTFIQGFSPTSPVEGNECDNSKTLHIASSSMTKATGIERNTGNVNFEGPQSKARYNNWHSEEKKKLQKTRSLLDEKDRFLTEQLRRCQIRTKTREDSAMSPLGYRPASSQQMLGETYSSRNSCGANRDYNAASEWDEVRLFSDRYSVGQGRRATSEMDYPLRDISIDRRNPSPVVDSMTRRRPLIRHYSDRDEFTYARTRHATESSASYRAYSPHTSGYLNGSPSHQSSQAEYTDDIPQVRRRNMRSNVQTSKFTSGNSYQAEGPMSSLIKDRNSENPLVSTLNKRVAQGSMGTMDTTILTDVDGGRHKPEHSKKTGNSGFQIRTENSSHATGISYYDPDDAYLSSDGNPLVSKLSIAHSPTERSMDAKQSSYASIPNRPLNNVADRIDEPQNLSIMEDVFLKRDCHSGYPEADLNGTNQNRQLTNFTKPSNTHNSNNSSIRKSAKIWYQPHMSRDEAIKYLNKKPPGTFIVRQSHTFNNSYGLAVKVSKNIQDGDNEGNIRHFLIESNSKGVRIRGCANEPYFGSLTALVHQHTLTKLALPCCINLPSSSLESDTDDSQVTFEITYNSNPQKPSLVFAPRTFVALYLGSVDTDSLTGITAISKSVEVLLQNRPQVKQTEVSIRVSPEGVTLTDVHRKLFFRRHYPIASISYCGIESNALWESSETRSRGVPKAKILGFVARKANANENMCHMLCEGSVQDSARCIANFIADCVVNS